MRIVDAWNALVGKQPEMTPAKPASVPQDSYHSGGTYRKIYSSHYDGEKNLGEAGPIIQYWPDYDALRLRSWQAYLESEVAQTVIKKFVLWIIGSGLKLQCEPATRVLESEGVTLDSEAFNDVAESRFKVFAKSRECDYARMRSLNKIAQRIFTNAIVGGDVLVILRYTDRVSIQVIDGCHVSSPIFGTDYFAQAQANGNKIRHGIELSPTGEHVAYFVRNDKFEYERVPARSESSGLTTAFLVYGLEYRLDNHRGLPLIAAVIETAKKMERYKEATLGSAEEVAKLAWQVVHQVYSTGENPLAAQMAKAFNADAVTDDIPEDINGQKLADKVAATTNKTAVNNPPGAEVRPINGGGKELYFKDFYSVNIDLVCASLCIPPEVAMSRYNSNFSASRAALKDWEHTINVNRADYSEQFYQRVYDYWLDINVLSNRVVAPGYLAARASKNMMVLAAYRMVRFVGATVPHIDPVKEVTAERLKLGDSGKNIPLTTAEAATEALNGGDSDQNMMQYAAELAKSKELGIVSEEPMDLPKDNPNDGNKD